MGRPCFFFLKGYRIKGDGDKVKLLLIFSMQDYVNKKLTETIKDSISKEFQSHKSLIEDSVLSAVRSRAVTPASHIVDQMQIIQAQIMQLVATGQINAAFQQVKSNLMV